MQCSLGCGPLPCGTRLAWYGVFEKLSSGAWLKACAIVPIYGKMKKTLPIMLL